MFFFFYHLFLLGCRSILADRIRWRFPPSTAGEAPYTSAVRWHQPAWCTSDTPTIDHFHWSSQYLARCHLPPGKTCTVRLTWRQTFSLPYWLAVRWLTQITKRLIGCFFVPQINILTFALNSAKKSKCFLRSVARMASMTKKRKRLNSTCSRLTRKLYSGRDKKRFQAEAAWWFSKTERSL